MTQRDKVLKLLRENGKITRNECLRMYISRLGAIILSLKKEGMNITGEYKDGDYIYTLQDKPKETIEYRVQGELVYRKLVWN